MYGEVPPETVILIDPISWPGSGQSTVVEFIVTVGEGVDVIVTKDEVLQISSLTVTV